MGAASWGCVHVAKFRTAMGNVFWSFCARSDCIVQVESATSPQIATGSLFLKADISESLCFWDLKLKVDMRMDLRFLQIEISSNSDFWRLRLRRIDISENWKFFKLRSPRLETRCDRAKSPIHPSPCLADGSERHHSAHRYVMTSSNRQSPRLANAPMRHQARTAWCDDLFKWCDDPVESPITPLGWHS